MHRRRRRLLRARLNELSFSEFFGEFPFLPWCALPNGSVDCQKEDRKRRTTEAGAPRNRLFDKYYSCIAEYSLGFGYSCASNTAQRFAFGILDIFRREFDADDAVFVAADRRRAPRYFAARDAASSQTGRDECRLAVVHMYTDDPFFVVW